MMAKHQESISHKFWQLACMTSSAARTVHSWPYRHYMCHIKECDVIIFPGSSKWSLNLEHQDWCQQATCVLCQSDCCSSSKIHRMMSREFLMTSSSAGARTPKWGAGLLEVLQAVTRSQLPLSRDSGPDGFVSHWPQPRIASQHRRLLHQGTTQVALRPCFRFPLPDPGHPPAPG